VVAAHTDELLHPYQSMGRKVADEHAGQPARLILGIIAY
jgi:hypothetical protein